MEWKRWPMSVKELLAEIQQLTLNERIQLAEAIMRGVREALSDDLRGVLKTNSEIVTSDQSLQEDYVAYLEEKYR